MQVNGSKFNFSYLYCPVNAIDCSYLYCPVNAIDCFLPMTTAAELLACLWSDIIIMKGSGPSNTLEHDIHFY